MIELKMQPKAPSHLAPKITVIGVGGAGGNAVNNMISSGLEGCHFFVCNTDAQALDGSLASSKLQLGIAVTGGLGAGSRPEVGRAAAEESLQDIITNLEGSNMVFVTAGMGGGTGTGAAPVIAKACRDRGILTVGVVTKPFHFEGAHRMRLAESGLEEMQGYVDTLIVIPNQNLFRIANEKTTFAEGFRMADSVLQSGVRGVTDLMVRPGLVNLDFADIRTAMQEMGKAMMGTGEASGDKRAVQAAEAAINNPLLDDVSMKGARGVIINITGGLDMTLFEVDEACNRIRDEVDPHANIIFGATFDEALDNIMRVSIVATGIDREESKEESGDQGSGGGGTALRRTAPITTFPPGGGQSAPVAQRPSQVSPQVNPYALSPRAPTIERSFGSTTPPAQDCTDPDGELFEQNIFSEQAATTPVFVSSNPPSLTIHAPPQRGERLGSAFIPPKPMEVAHAGGHLSYHQRAAMTHNTSFPQNASESAKYAPAQSAIQQPLYASAPSQDFVPTQGQTPTATPLAPQPPIAPRVPSFLERLTGVLPQHSAPLSVPSVPVSSSSSAMPNAQGSLEMRTPPAMRSKESLQAEDGLDIPAFLRRQAN